MISPTKLRETTSAGYNADGLDRFTRSEEKGDTFARRSVDSHGLSLAKSAAQGPTTSLAKKKTMASTQDSRGPANTKARRQEQLALLETFEELEDATKGETMDELPLFMSAQYRQMLENYKFKAAATQVVTEEVDKDQEKKQARFSRLYRNQWLQTKVDE